MSKTIIKIASLTINFAAPTKSDSPIGALLGPLLAGALFSSAGRRQGDDTPSDPPPPSTATTAQPDIRVRPEVDLADDEVLNSDEVIGYLEGKLIDGFGAYQRVHWSGKKFDFDGLVEDIQQGYDVNDKVVFVRRSDTNKLVSLTIADLIDPSIDGLRVIA